MYLLVAVVAVVFKLNFNDDDEKGVVGIILTVVEDGFVVATSIGT